VFDVKVKTVLPKRIAIVEDERITARYLQSIITKQNIEVMGIYDNAEALLSALNDERPDMIMMDINIKGKVDGLELTEMIAKEYQIPVVFITAYCDSDTLSKAMRLSPYGYIVKPFTEVDIVIAIKLAQQRYLENHHETEEHQETKVRLTMHCWFDTINQTLTSHDEQLHLNAKQLQLLQLLIKHKNLAVSQELIEQTLWIDGPTSSSTVRTLVYSIRKLAPGLIIETQSKIGYILRTVT